jgi:DNA-directed RNA polymerase subunit M/transcription elongation factor TFIIS
MFEEHLKKYFGKQKNIDYILKKTNGKDQKVKIYEILCMLNNPNDTLNIEEKLNKIVPLIRNDRLLWSNPIFEKEKCKLEEENDFIICPYELSEGVLICKKCQSQKIFSFSKQTRSMDEPTTIFALCSNCKNRWSE